MVHAQGIPVVQEYLQLSVWLGEAPSERHQKDFISNGLEGRTHGNTKRAPHHASPFNTIKNTIIVIQNYVEQNETLLPSHLPYQKRVTAVI